MTHLGSRMEVQVADRPKLFRTIDRKPGLHSAQFPSCQLPGRAERLNFITRTVILPK